MVLGGTSQIHATPLYSFSNEREQILAGCQVSVTYNFIVGGGTGMMEEKNKKMTVNDGLPKEAVNKDTRRPGGGRKPGRGGPGGPPHTGEKAKDFRGTWRKPTTPDKPNAHA